MSLRVMTVTLLGVVGILISGCELTEQSSPKLEPESKHETKATKPGGDPGPKPRPKVEPQYPSVEQVLNWHAAQCGGFKITEQKQSILAEQELKGFFKMYCLKATSEPKKVMTQLIKLDQAYFWPDDIKQYLWLLKQQLKQHIKAQQAQQTLNEKMQQTMSSLATIEQQLLLREDTKEQ